VATEAEWVEIGPGDHERADSMAVAYIEAQHAIRDAAVVQMEMQRAYLATLQDVLSVVQTEPAPAPRPTREPDGYIAVRIEEDGDEGDIHTVISTGLHLDGGDAVEEAIDHIATKPGRYAVADVYVGEEIR
jgi:hypothetical protein